MERERVEQEAEWAMDLAVGLIKDRVPLGGHVDLASAVTLAVALLGRLSDLEDLRAGRLQQ